MTLGTSYSVQGPGRGAAILNAYRSAAVATRYDRLTGLFAFASAKGARVMADALGASSSWRASSKRWVISIDGGTTEPDALRFLLSLRGSEVRIPCAEELLSRGLQPRHRFHPKTVLLESDRNGYVPTAIIVGSANLTWNGLCVGHEHVVAMSTTAAQNELRLRMPGALDDLETSVAAATVVDSTLIDRYAAIRQSIPRPSEECDNDRAGLILQANPVLPASQAATLAAATNLWIEIERVVANRGRASEGNQIDMQRGTRVYFGFGDMALPRNSQIGSVRISWNGNSVLRNLRFGNNYMDKLDLPIPGVDGPSSYRRSTLLFTREPNDSFRLSVGLPAEVASWKACSQALGALYEMRGGRQFGVF